MEIDVQNYGRYTPEPAAATQQPFEHNSYNPDEEFPVHTELLDTPVDAPVNAVNTPVQEINPQADNFRALREEVDRIKHEKEAEKREYQLQIDMLKANMAPRVHSQERKMFEGMDDSDVPNVRELRSEWNAREASYKMRLEELQTQTQYPDYNEVLNKYLAPLIKQKPHLSQGIESSSNPSLMAYELGKMYQASQHMPSPEPQIQQRSETAQRIVDNSRKIGTLSQAGGQTALSQADYFATMSDAEFMRMASKNLEGI